LSRLVVEGTLEALDEVAEFVLKASQEAGLERKAAYRLRLAVDEIATNIVNYGYLASGSSGSITVEADLTPDWLTIRLEDTAPLYDPRNRDMPTEEELALPLEERPIGGLGIYLTLQGVDEFDYRATETGNCNIFRMRRPQGEGHA
jgi:serine/threonine-protein kinase RsbW